MSGGRKGETPVGLHAIIDLLGLEVPRPAVRSLLVGGPRKTRVTEAGVLESYPRAYDPGTGVLGHLRFALRYEPVDLGVYKAAFRRIDRQDLERWIQGEPNGIFARRAWYLYELLEGRKLAVDDLTSGPYVELLNPDLHVAGPPVRIRRQRVFDNLLGNRDFCPLIRRSDKLGEALSQDLAGQARSLLADLDPAVLKRAVHYLFTKETRSSFEIEGEHPSSERAGRFVSALMRADAFDPGDKASFTSLQNAIVDPRYAQSDWRKEQVYVGETLPDYSQLVHFVCPRPGDVPSLMEGWMRMAGRLLGPSSTVHPVCAASLLAYGFVFIHPFQDGNGRIHRFLVHKVLSAMGFSPSGMVFPVSAAMLRDRAAYDRSLECFSAAIAPFIRYTMGPDQSLAVENATADLYRYFDATAQAEFLFDCVAGTIRRDLKQELEFLVFFDRAAAAAREVVDMPGQRASLLIRLIHQNQGRLSKAKRALFAELTDEEIGRIEAGIQAAAGRTWDSGD